MMTANSLFRPDLLAKYSANGPRYTSYPTALQFRDDFDCAAYLRAAADPDASATDLSLYFHIPFCDTVCFYCGCNNIATKNRTHARPYLERHVVDRDQAAEAPDDVRRCQHRRMSFRPMLSRRLAHKSLWPKAITAAS